MMSWALESSRQLKLYPVKLRLMGLPAGNLAAITAAFFFVRGDFILFWGK